MERSLRVDRFCAAAKTTSFAILQWLRNPGFTAVAVTDDILKSTEGNDYVNAQVGEGLVTNPEDESAAEEYLLDWREARKDRLMRASNCESSNCSNVAVLRAGTVRHKPFSSQDAPQWTRWTSGAS